MTMVTAAIALFLAQGGPAPDTGQLAFMAQAESRNRSGGDGQLYEAGTSALDASRWDDALRSFSEAAERKGPRADGALYWKAYAQNRLGRRDESLATIALLRRQYPKSRWMDDAQALEMEVNQGKGSPVSPSAESSDDLKLMAINGLMTSDSERAVPLLENLLKGGSSRRLKERALFVLAQSGSARGRAVLVETAKGGANPDLQLTAVKYLAMLGGADAQHDLAAIYTKAGEMEVKRAVLQGYLLGGAKEPLLSVAKTEKNADLRHEAIRELAMMGAHAELWQLYQREPSLENKEQIVQSMFIGGNADRLLEIAKNEKEPKLRRAAIRSLGLMGARSGGSLANLYTSETDPEIRKEILNALFLQQNAKALVEIARKETHPELKHEAVQKLSLIRSKETTDYMLEILNK